jgi:hypothetical protein
MTLDGEETFHFHSISFFTVYTPMLVEFTSSLGFPVFVRSSQDTHKSPNAIISSSSSSTANTSVSLRSSLGWVGEELFE